MSCALNVTIPEVVPDFDNSSPKRIQRADITKQTTIIALINQNTP